jgi:hypothetical protein
MNASSFQICPTDYSSQRARFSNAIEKVARDVFWGLFNHSPAHDFKRLGC